MHLYVYIIYISIYNNHFGQYFDNKLDKKNLPEAFFLQFMNLFSFLFFLNIKIIPTRNVGSVIPFALIFCFLEGGVMIFTVFPAIVIIWNYVNSFILFLILPDKTRRKNQQFEKTIEKLENSLEESYSFFLKTIVITCVILFFVCFSLFICISDFFWKRKEESRFIFKKSCTYIFPTLREIICK